MAKNLPESTARQRSYFLCEYSTLRLLCLADGRNYDITGVTILNRFYSEIKQEESEDDHDAINQFLSFHL